MAFRCIEVICRGWPTNSDFLLYLYDRYNSAMYMTLLKSHTVFLMSYHPYWDRLQLDDPPVAYWTTFIWLKWSRKDMSNRCTLQCIRLHVFQHTRYGTEGTWQHTHSDVTLALGPMYLRRQGKKKLAFQTISKCLPEQKKITEWGCNGSHSLSQVSWKSKKKNKK